MPFWKSKKDEKRSLVPSTATNSPAPTPAHPLSRVSIIPPNHTRAGSTQPPAPATIVASTPTHAGQDNGNNSEESGGDEETEQNPFLLYTVENNKRVQVIEGVPSDGNWPKTPENQHIRWNVTSVNRVIELLREATPGIGRRVLNYWFQSSKQLPANVYQRSLSEIGLGFPLWEPIDIYQDDKPSSKQICVRIGAIGMVNKDGWLRLVQSYDPETEPWESQSQRKVTHYGTGYIMRSGSYEIKGGTFWSKEYPPEGGILFLRAPLYSKDAAENIRGLIRESALQHITSPPKNLIKSKEKARESDGPFYITGYDSTKSCIMAAHRSLYKVGFNFKQKSSVQDEGEQTFAWKGEKMKSTSQGSRSAPTAGGVQTICHSTKHERSIVMRGFRVEIRKGFRDKLFRFIPGSASFERSQKQKLNLKIAAGNITLVELWEKKPKANLIGYLNNKHNRAQSTQNETDAGPARRMRGGAGDNNRIHSARGEVVFGEEGGYHPSDIINKLKLALYTEATIVTTHDDEWTQLLRAEDEMPSDHLLFERWVEAAITGQISPELTIGVNYLHNNQLQTHILSEPFLRPWTSSTRLIRWVIIIHLPSGLRREVPVPPIRLTPGRLMLPSFRNAAIRWRANVVMPDGQALVVEGRVLVSTLLEQLP